MGRKIDILSEARETRDTEVEMDGSGINVGLIVYWEVWFSQG